ncbi:DUF1648 domain-containing protein [Segetibacter koreensis]|uniref:DUF1648 domain-containing protein n=1 Tax=Segetibacter koreensis TaxID=398037 RepID=UPI00036B8BC9|nr:DUF1648 domain-containing protein [Segetibacter koreensis]
MEIEARPKVKLNLSPVDKSLEMTSKIFLVVIWGLTLYTFLKLPTIIPTHFNASGQVDSYGNKKTLIILPLLATIIYFVLTQINKHPRGFTYLIKITEDNAEKQYAIATRMYRFLKLATLVIFSLIILFTYLTTIGVTNGLGFWFLPLTEVLLLIPTAIGIMKSLEKKNKVA